MKRKYKAIIYHIILFCLISQICYAKKCSICGVENKELNKYCINCGQKIEENKTIYCPHCGAKNNVNNKFCVACGEQINDIPHKIEISPYKDVTGYNKNDENIIKKNALSLGSNVTYGAADSSGFGIDIGYGNAFAGFGVNASYFIQNTNNINCVLFIGGGTFGVYSGMVIGARLGFGKKHRGFVSFSYGLFGYETASRTTYDNSSRTVVYDEYYSEPIIGPSFCAGYEFLSYGGFHLFSEVGLSYGSTQIFGNILLPTISIGIGWKFIHITKYGVKAKRSDRENSKAG